MLILRELGPTWKKLQIQFSNINQVRDEIHKGLFATHPQLGTNISNKQQFLYNTYAQLLRWITYSLRNHQDKLMLMRFSVGIWFRLMEIEVYGVNTIYLKSFVFANSMRITFLRCWHELVFNIWKVNPLSSFAFFLPKAT